MITTTSQAGYINSGFGLATEVSSHRTFVTKVITTVMNTYKCRGLSKPID